MLRLHSWWLGVGLVGLVGCGSEPVTPLGSGVDPEKPITELTFDEHEAVCDAAQAYSAERTTIEASCRYHEFQAAYVFREELEDEPLEELRQTCRDDVRFCSEVPSAGSRPVLDACSFVEPCTAEVRPFEECLISFAERMEELTRDLPTCDEVTLDWVVEHEELFHWNALATDACDALPERCEWQHRSLDLEVGGAGGTSGD